MTNRLIFKVSIPLIALLGTLLAVAATAHRSLERMQGVNDALTGRFHEIERVRQLEGELMGLTHLLFATGAGGTHGPHQHQHDDLDEVQRESRGRLHRIKMILEDLNDLDDADVPAEREVLEFTSGKIQDIERGLDKAMAATNLSGFIEALRKVNHHHIEPLTARLGSWHAQELVQVDALNRESRQSIESFQWGLMMFGIFAAAVLVLALIYFNAALTRRVVAILQGTQALMRGEFDHQIHVEGRDELHTVARDINQMARDLVSYRNRLSSLAQTDELTGLPNRRAMEELLPKELARARRRDRSVALMMLDLDHFKNINDTWGHEVGDQALINAAVWISGEVRQDEHVFRLGGEEFVIFLPEVEPGDAMATAERIRKRIEESSFVTDDNEIGFTTSIGMVEASGGEMSLHRLINHADRALYTAKREGRNCCVQYRNAEPKPQTEIIKLSGK